MIIRNNVAGEAGEGGAKQGKPLQQVPLSHLHHRHYHEKLVADHDHDYDNHDHDGGGGDHPDNVGDRNEEFPTFSLFQIHQEQCEEVAGGNVPQVQMLMMFLMMIMMTSSS